MLDKIITIYAIVDDLLKAIGHTEDIRCQMSDAEIITTALVGSIFFGGNHSQACNYMKDHQLILKMLQKSRFNLPLGVKVPCFYKQRVLRRGKIPVAKRNSKF